jgi:hypothetical protein
LSKAVKLAGQTSDAALLAYAIGFASFFQGGGVAARTCQDATLAVQEKCPVLAILPETLETDFLLLFLRVDALAAASAALVTLAIADVVLTDSAHCLTLARFLDHCLFLRIWRVRRRRALGKPSFFRFIAVLHRNNLGDQYFVPLAGRAVCFGFEAGQTFVLIAMARARRFCFAVA